MPNLVDIVSDVPLSHPWREGVHAALVQVLGALNGSWKVEIRRVDKSRWWELSVQGYTTRFCMLFREEEQRPEIVRERLAAALERRGYVTEVTPWEHGKGPLKPSL